MNLSVIFVDVLTESGIVETSLCSGLPLKWIFAGL